MQKAFNHIVTCLFANERFIFVATAAPELIIFEMKPEQVPAEVKKIVLSQGYQAPSELIVVEDTHCICLQQKEKVSHLRFVSLEEDSGFLTTSINHPFVCNITGGSDFFICNDSEGGILAFARSDNSFLSSDSAVEGQKGDRIIKRLRSDNDKNIFLAFNAQRHSFKTFQSNGRDLLCEDLKEIHFSEGLDKASPIRLRNPIAYDIIQMGDNEDGNNNYCLMALDWKTVKRGDHVFLTDEKLQEILTTLGVEANSRRALDYHKTMAAKLKPEEVKEAKEALEALDNDPSSLLSGPDLYNLTE